MRKKIKRLPFYMMKGAPIEAIKEQIKIREELMSKYPNKDHRLTELDVLKAYLQWRELGYEIGEIDYE